MYCMKWLGLTFFLFPLAALAAEENPLKPLAKEMAEMELMLRDDRHDAFVRIKGDGIENNLAEMITKMEKEQQEQQQNQKQDPQQKQKQQREQSRQQRQQQLSSNPITNSQPKAPTPSGPTNTAQVSGTGSKWAKLPPAAREELLQTYRDDIPERWRKRLEAYFLSIAAEEVEKERR